jgi:hypothetical protein
MATATPNAQLTRRTQVAEELARLLKRMRSGEEEVWAELVEDPELDEGPRARESILACVLGFGEPRPRLATWIEVDAEGWSTLEQLGAELGGDRSAAVDALCDEVSDWYQRDAAAVGAWVAEKMRSGARQAWTNAKYSLPIDRAAFLRFGDVAVALCHQLDVGGADFCDMGFDLIAYAIGDPDVVRHAARRGLGTRRDEAPAPAATR